MAFSYMHFGLKIWGNGTKTKINEVYWRRKSMRQKLFMPAVQVTVSNLFHFDEI